MPSTSARNAERSSKRTCSGRTPHNSARPETSSRSAGTPTGASPMRMASAPCASAASKGRKFIDGAPMKSATNTLAGRSYTSSGAPSCSMTPWFMMAMTSAMAMASIWSCVTYTVVACSRSCSARSSRHITSRNSESSAPSGSSIKKASGSRTMARPSATRCRSPLDSCDTGLSSKSTMRRTRAACSTCRSISARGMPCDTSGNAMLRRTFICG